MATVTRVNACPSPVITEKDVEIIVLKLSSLFSCFFLLQDQLVTSKLLQPYDKEKVSQESSPVPPLTPSSYLNSRLSSVWFTGGGWVFRKDSFNNKHKWVVPTEKFFFR